MKMLRTIIILPVADEWLIESPQFGEQSISDLIVKLMVNI